MNQQLSPREMRALVFVAVTREFILTGQLINDYQTDEPEWRWCEDRVQQLNAMVEAVGDVDKVRQSLIETHMEGNQ